MLCYVCSMFIHSTVIHTCICKCIKSVRVIMPASKSYISTSTFNLNTLLYFFFHPLRILSERRNPWMESYIENEAWQKCRGDRPWMLAISRHRIHSLIRHYDHHHFLFAAGPVDVRIHWVCQLRFLITGWWQCCWLHDMHFISTDRQQNTPTNIPEHEPAATQHSNITILFD